jgi:hypothetical protein
VKREELKAALLATGGGTRREMAEAVGIDPSSSSGKRALAELLAEEKMEAVGTTSDRIYTLPGQQPPPPSAPEDPDAPDPSRYQREFSPRKARVCPECGRRSFGDLEWTCDKHGVAEDQEDRPYMGRYPKTARVA